MRPLLLLPLLVLADGLGCRLALDAPPRPAVVHRRAAAPSFRRRSPSPLALFGLGADDKKTADAESDQRLLDALFGDDPAEVWAEIAAENELLEELGVRPEPAQPPAQGDDDDDNEPETKPDEGVENE